MIEPQYDYNGVIIIRGHVFDVLKDMEPESVQMCVTSPPYWGLRDYGLEPQIWDGQERCEHEWGNDVNPRTFSGGIGTGIVGSYQDNRTHYKTTGDQFCQLCGAWRGSLGLELDPDLYIKHLTDIFREVRRVLKKDGTLWLNLGDTYASQPASTGVSFRRDRKEVLPKGKRLPRGSGRWGGGNMPAINGLKPKDLCEIPSDVVRALRNDGWYLRSRIPWIKRNCMPERCKDRPTTAVDYVFLLSKSRKYYYDYEAVKLPASLDTHTRARRNSDWFFESFQGLLSDENGYPLALLINSRGFKEAHFAVFPEKLIEPCILTGSRIGDTVLDPFGGSGTTGRVAKRLNRKVILIDLSPEYCEMASKFLKQSNLLFKEEGDGGKEN